MPQALKTPSPSSPTRGHGGRAGRQEAWGPWGAPSAGTVATWTDAATCIPCRSALDARPISPPGPAAAGPGPLTSSCWPQSLLLEGWGARGLPGLRASPQGISGPCQQDCLAFPTPPCLHLAPCRTRLSPRVWGPGGHSSHLPGVLPSCRLLPGPPSLLSLRSGRWTDA